jgi:hypothetical protein
LKEEGVKFKTTILDETVLFKKDRMIYKIIKDSNLILQKGESFTKGESFNFEMGVC